MFSSIIQQYVKDKMKRWRLFYATDFQTLMYLCFTFHRILGIFPYKINASIFETSKPHYIMLIVIVCACLVFDVVFIQAIINYTINLGDITRNLEITFFNMFSGFILIITYVLSGPRMRLLQTLLEISSKLSSESYQKLSRLIHVKDILCTIFLVVQMCISLSSMFFDKLDYLMVLSIIFEAYFDMVVFQINMLYINCLCVLKACYKSINDNLMHMQILMANNIKLYNLRLIYHVQRDETLLIELKILKKWHLMVSDAIKKLNAVFSLQLLAIIAMCISNITFQVYFYAVRWQDGISINFDTYFTFGPFARAIVYYILNIILLVWACETGKNQAQEISTTIHDILNSTNNELIKNELQLFSIQVLQHKNIFLVKGITVDATLLTTIIGNITTYLIIFIQFLSASHSCDRKTAINVIQSY